MGYLVKFQVMLLPGITSAHANIHHVLSSPWNHHRSDEKLFILILQVNV